MRQITLNEIERAVSGENDPRTARRRTRRRLADRFGITYQAVRSWFLHGQIPETRALGVAELSGFSAEQVLRARGYTEAPETTEPATA